MWRIWIALPLVIATCLAFGTFCAFTHRLRRAHPDLWVTYRSLFYSTLGSTSRSSVLASEVFNKITDQRSCRLRTAYRICFGIYAVVTVACVILLWISLATPAL